ncbi:MAG: adaptor protein MecA [Porcipelethomonas sp.]
MMIDKLSDNALKIYLDNDDLEKYDTDSFSINGSSIKEILLSLSEEISELLNISLENQRLYVEVFSRKSGCMIFVSFVSERAAKRTNTGNIICESDDFDNIKNLCSNIKIRYADSLGKSTLYCNRNFMRLYLELTSEYNEICHMASGYCRLLPATGINMGVTQEYFSVVSSDNAVDELSRFSS